MLPQHKEVLQNCTVEGMVVKLPAGQLDRNLYMDVAKSLTLIGGKWKGGKTMGFVFDEDPTDLLEEIATGEKRNLKKEFQFFATPDCIADQLVRMAEIEQGQTIIEPSAGSGSIIKAIHRVLPEVNVGCYETMPTNKIILNKLDYCALLGDDFLETEARGVNEMADRIIANPPFSNNQDIDHIKRMYEYCKFGGRVVSISSTHWQTSGNKKETQFRDWLSEVNAQIHKLDAGTFKESGTNIATVIIVIDK